MLAQHDIKRGQAVDILTQRKQDAGDTRPFTVIWDESRDEWEREDKRRHLRYEHRMDEA